MRSPIAPVSRPPLPPRLLAPWVPPLAIYVLLRGLDATVLKALQDFGQAHAVHGENPISFCNVFFFSQLMVGLAALLPGRRDLAGGLASLTRSDRGLVVAHSFLGMVLGPVAYFLALESLSVISQTLLFALVLPTSALLARGLLREPLPPRFWMSVLLIASGLLLPHLAMASMGVRMDHPVGLVWAAVGVLAFGGSAVTSRALAPRHLPPAVTLGLGSIAAALAFAAIALVRFGPHHFLLLQLWWVVGVIGIYALTLTLGSEWNLRKVYRHCGVATVSLWGSLSIVVAVASATLLLGEPFHAATALGITLLLAGVFLGRRPSPPGGR